MHDNARIGQANGLLEDKIKTRYYVSGAADSALRFGGRRLILKERLKDTRGSKSYFPLDYSGLTRSVLLQKLKL
jgi:hypothetical protein